MARPSRFFAKVTSKNQLTLPRAALEAAGWPTHFRVQVHRDGRGQPMLILWPGLLMTAPEAARALGIDEVAMQAARVESRRRAEGESGIEGEG